METPRDTFELALAGSELGYRFIPCRPGTKVPLVKWKAYQSQSPTADLYERWFKNTRNNVAVLTNGMVLFDCDEIGKADLVIGECGETPWKVLTPRGGIHLGYRKRKGENVTNQVKIMGEPIDIRTDGGLALLPPSETEHGAYVWFGEGLIPVAKLPFARIGWTRDRIRNRSRGAFYSGGVLREGKGSIRFPEAYCLRIKSVQGQNGSRSLVRVCCVLRDAGRSKQQIFDFLTQVWGPACCVPPWSERELLHCIERH